MKFLVTGTPGPMPPPVDRVRAAQEWLQAKLDDGTFECVYAFPEGGGFTISETDSHETLMELLMEYPLSPFIEYDVKALVGLDDAFERFIPFIERVSAELAGATS